MPLLSRLKRRGYYSSNILQRMFPPQGATPSGGATAREARGKPSHYYFVCDLSYLGHYNSRGKGAVYTFTRRFPPTRFYCSYHRGVRTLRGKVRLRVFVVNVRDTTSRASTTSHQGASANYRINIKCTSQFLRQGRHIGLLTSVLRSTPRHFHSQRVSREQALTSSFSISTSLRFNYVALRFLRRVGRNHSIHKV